MHRACTAPPPEPYLLCHIHDMHSVPTFYCAPGQNLLTHNAHCAYPKAAAEVAWHSAAALPAEKGPLAWPYHIQGLQGDSVCVERR